MLTSGEMLRGWYAAPRLQPTLLVRMRSRSAVQHMLSVRGGYVSGWAQKPDPVSLGHWLSTESSYGAATQSDFVLSVHVSPTQPLQLPLHFYGNCLNATGAQLVSSVLRPTFLPQPLVSAFSICNCAAMAAAAKLCSCVRFEL